MRQIGAELDVGFVLEGSVRWDRQPDGPGRIRITPQLIRVADDTHLWAERYDRTLKDVFAVQSEIAQAVVRHTGSALLGDARQALGAVPTRNTEAHQAYLRGLDRRDRRGCQVVRLPGLESLRIEALTRTGDAMDFDCAVGHDDDPVLGDPGLGVKARLGLDVLAPRRVCDLHDQARAPRRKPGSRLLLGTDDREVPVRCPEGAAGAATLRSTRRRARG